MTTPKTANRADRRTIKATSDKLTAATAKAVKTLLEVMQNEQNTPAVRAQAADAVLRHCLRYVEQADILERIKALEQAQAAIFPVIEEGENNDEC